MEKINIQIGNLKICRKNTCQEGKKLLGKEILAKIKEETGPWQKAKKPEAEKKSQDKEILS